MHHMFLFVGVSVCVCGGCATTFASSISIQKPSYIYSKLLVVTEIIHMFCNSKEMYQILFLNKTLGLLNFRKASSIFYTDTTVSLMLKKFSAENQALIKIFV